MPLPPLPPPTAASAPACREALTRATLPLVPAQANTASSPHTSDPFASFLSHSHTRHATLSSPLGFTASLAMRRMAQVAKVLSNLKKSPLFNPPGVVPVSQPSSSSSLPLTATPSFLPHLTALSHHPSLALLTYPPSSYLAHQGTHASLINLVVSGRVRFLKDGVLCAEASRGALVGVDSALMGSERYRRLRRGQRRRRLKRHQAAEADYPLGAPPPADDAERHAAEDEAELRLDAEERVGRKKRRLRVAHYCSVQCVDEVECVVFPASVLLSYVESDRALLSHAFRHVTAVHWMRRTQWRDAERRLHHLWSHPPALGEPGYGDPAGGACAEAGPAERKVLGSAGFAYFGLIAATALGEERVRRYTREQSASLEHPMFALARGEGGGPVERRRLKVGASAARGGDRQQREEVRRLKDKEERARKVRRVVDAMERSRRRQQPPPLSRATSDDFLDSDASDSDYDSTDDNDDAEPDPLADERYAAAMSHQQLLTSPRGAKKSSRTATPKFKLHRRLPVEGVGQKGVPRMQLVLGLEAERGGGGSGITRTAGAHTAAHGQGAAAEYAGGGRRGGPGGGDKVHCQAAGEPAGGEGRAAVRGQ